MVDPTWGDCGFEDVALPSSLMCSLRRLVNERRVVVRMLQPCNVGYWELGTILEQNFYIFSNNLTDDNRCWRGNRVS